ncbi:terminase small subunit, partial [Vibrio phage 1.240.O._10N.261.52.F8]
SGLTAKQRRFVEEYCGNGFNATKAAKSAGYSEKTAKQQGTENLSKPAIQDAIEDFMGKATKKALITTEGLVERLLSEAEYFGEGASHSARIAALKALTDFTGGFDANKKQVEHSGSVPLTIILDEDED